MSKYKEFEASLLEMLVDKCSADRDAIASLLRRRDLDGRTLVREALAMKLCSPGRLARLISQYWELPLVDIAFPYRRFLSHCSRPIDDLLELDLLPLEFAPGEVTVVSYYVPDEEAVERIEEARKARVRVYITVLSSMDDALLRVRQEVKRFQSAQPVDCGTDKELFYKVTAEGWPAIVREGFGAATIRIEFDRQHRLTKSVDKLDPSEPEAVRTLLVGKSMSCEVRPGMKIRKLVDGFVETVSLFDGDLREAILKLRVAQMLLDDEKDG
jgi:hypothetical protein